MLYAQGDFFASVFVHIAIYAYAVIGHLCLASLTYHVFCHNFLIYLLFKIF